MHDSDEVLMRRLARGETDALDVLIRRHTAMVLNTLYRIVLSPADAEDLCQDVFEKLWVQAPSWRPEAKLSTWLYRVASNLAINHRQRVQQRFVVDTELAEQLCDGDDQGQGQGADSRSASKLNAALSQLPENQRAALYFRYHHGFSTSEIANILELSSKAVESLLGRARTNLSLVMGKTGADL